jgi:alkanesulfonate monooxygenase SsuD/methylene tetrahydromethanopterin reductase-like flavin-dependent oxidoreductase (luciferase family)
MLEEAIGLIRHLWEGHSVTHRGRYFTVEDARIFDRPIRSHRSSYRLSGRKARNSPLQSVTDCG